ncbi:MAG: glycosyltransferase [Sphingobium sp.]|jgi:glycosyltransferase involved in cell wall biosynthesis|uniref:glycosyltransferase n=1 Tax=Sphingobium sp. JS3065 TaxID=2970925 RepID=UPI002263FDD7|nr:glycosyltransferase [Sphingobium sp. JS3065]MCI1270686.1 glycosyltransferase [Sphingobium sp.]MCI1754415.1 glycosyltransferase [Sphingobium sp.]MCI2053355.1 glycosyltransferase [Sphingobium sp.]UZW56739.1 glycosyltransferase [Sphingobium sp. JS3065]
MQQPFRVMIFLHSFEPGGVERVALRLTQAWTERGIDTQLVLGRSDGAMRSEWPALSYSSLAIRGIATGRFETLWMILRLPGEIRRQRPDILFCAGNTYTVVAVAMKLLLGSTCPPIVAKVSNDLARRDLVGPVRWGYRLWLRIQGRLIDQFVGMASPMFTEIADAMALLRSQVAIINDPAISAADIPRAERVRSLRDGDDRGTRYIAVGRLVAQKNFALLIGAFAAMAGPQDCLTILGDGPERTSLTRLIAEVGMTGQVYMPGHIGPVIERLKASDVFVLSSDYEGVPAVIIEALAAGLVIVATDCSVSMASLLEHGALGELVPRRSLWCLEQAMRAAAVRTPDPGRARRQASRFTVECAADAYAALFARQITKARNVPNPEKNSHGADAML